MVASLKAPKIGRQTHRRAVFDCKNSAGDESGTPKAIVKMQGGNGMFLGRMTLIREVYRSLLNRGRTYGAFANLDEQLVRDLAGARLIFDPMSGYGLLTAFCSKFGISSYCLEFNAPQYLWQLLCHPGRSALFLNAIHRLFGFKRRWPLARVRATASNDLFPDESKRILLGLLELSEASLKPLLDSSCDPVELAIALVLPFVGRLACTAPGDNSTHAKEGGICVYCEWERDFELYLTVVSRSLQRISETAKSTEHILQLGDARTFRFSDEKFSAMVTSPPYPNHRDFSTIFLPENACLAWLGEVEKYKVPTAPREIIGSNFVSQKRTRKPVGSSALAFIESIRGLKKSKQAEYDDETYDLPYFEHYFSDLEDAYGNVASALATQCRAYVIVVNNTHRGLVIPLSAVIQEIWSNLGFATSILRAIESFHVGTKNPRAKGIRARHTEYVVRLER